MVIPQRFKFYFVFVLSSFYRHGAVRGLVAAFYLCEGDSNRQNKFDQSKRSNYGHQYVEELKL